MSSPIPVSIVEARRLVSVFESERRRLQEEIGQPWNLESDLPHLIKRFNTAVTDSAAGGDRETEIRVEKEVPADQKEVLTQILRQKYPGYTVEIVEYHRVYHIGRQGRKSSPVAPLTQEGQGPITIKLGW